MDKKTTKSAKKATGKKAGKALPKALGKHTHARSVSVGSGSSKTRTAGPKGAKTTSLETTVAGKTTSKKKSAAKGNVAKRDSPKASRKQGGGAGGPAPGKATGEARPSATTARDPLPDRWEDRGPEVPRPLRKTRLTPQELDTFRDLLLTKRKELLGTVSQLRDDALNKSRQESAGDLSSMPIHMADIGTDNWEQEFTLGLLANENELLREIDEALQRIDQGTYGVCLATNRPIQKRRLRAQPWAKYCIEYARELELRRGR